MEILILSLLTAIAFFILLMKAGIRKFAKHSLLTDVIISGVLTILFIGTFSGMVTALVAGIFISLMLAIAKWWMALMDRINMRSRVHKTWIKS